MAAIANAKASVTLVNIVILLGTKPKPASGLDRATPPLFHIAFERSLNPQVAGHSGHF
jgi:hypothetical protein